MTDQAVTDAIGRGQRTVAIIEIESARLHVAARALFDVGGLPVVDAVMADVRERLARLPVGEGVA